MPTGSGKTVVFLSIAKQSSKECLILVHREILLKQTVKQAILMGFKKSEIATITSSKKEKPKRLTIAMVQTLYRGIHQYDQDAFDLIIVDEAHHSTAHSYDTIFKYFNVFEDKKRLLGFTATPTRNDNNPLSRIFGSHSSNVSIKEVIQKKYLCPIVGLSINIKKNLRSVKKIGNDYDASKLDKLINCKSINKEIIKKCVKHAIAPGIVFCVSINHAEALADLLNKSGKKAVSVSYKTPKNEFEKAIYDLRQGKLDFITNAFKLSEGFDCPSIRTIILARPTKSAVLYQQMIGRGLRIHDQKEECLVIEFSGNDPEMICFDTMDETCKYLKKRGPNSKNTAKRERKDALPDIIISDTDMSEIGMFEDISNEDEFVDYNEYFFNKPSSVDVRDDVDKIILRGNILEVAKTLSEREYTVLVERFGLLDNEPKTLKEIAEILNVSSNRIRQIETKAIRKMRHPTRSGKLKIFWLSDREIEEVENKRIQDEIRKKALVEEQKRRRKQKRADYLRNYAELRAERDAQIAERDAQIAEAIARKEREESREARERASSEQIRIREQNIINKKMKWREKQIDRIKGKIDRSLPARLYKGKCSCRSWEYVYHLQSDYFEIMCTHCYGKFWMIAQDEKCEDIKESK